MMTARSKQKEMHGAAGESRGGAPLPAPELSREVKLARVAEHPVRLEIEPDRKELAALRARFELEALDSLTATVVLERLGHGGLYRLQGDLRAAVTQLCVMTLEPIESMVEGSFCATFIELEDTEAPDQLGEIDLGEDLEEDPPEPFSGDHIDVGEAVVQQFATMLDPYPRSPEAELDPALTGDSESTRESPFAVLEELKTPRKPSAD